MTRVFSDTLIFIVAQVSVLALLFSVGYWMVDLLAGKWITSIIAFAVFECIMLGLLEVAVAMVRLGNCSL